MRPYILIIRPPHFSPSPLLGAKERGPGVRFPLTIAQNGDERYRSPPFAALCALCETVFDYPLTLPAVRPSTRNFCP